MPTKYERSRLAGQYRLMHLQPSGPHVTVVSNNLAWLLLLARRRRIKGRTWIDDKAEPAIRSSTGCST
jgi:hypothetical protein